MGASHRCSISAPGHQDQNNAFSLQSLVPFSFELGWIASEVYFLFRKQVCPIGNECLLCLYLENLLNEA